MAARARRPVVGVTGPDQGGLTAWWMTRLAVALAGGRAVRITASRPLGIDTLDALVLGGGADVADGSEDAEQADGDGKGEPTPDDAEFEETRRSARALSWLEFLATALLAPLTHAARYVAGRFSQAGAKPDAERDALEAELLASAEGRGLPVLGICRGAQLMNLQAGGSLLRDVGSFYVERPQLYTVLPRREIDLIDDCQLADIFGTRATFVNSLHAHAIDQPGTGVHVVARDLHGVIQAIERPEAHFWIGVQWHPEYLPQLRMQRRLFAALVARAGRAREVPSPARLVT